MTSAAAELPDRIGPYEILKRLGTGGMAEVFLAKKRGAEGTYKLLVLKRVLPAFGQSRRFRQMFIAEAQLATRLNHPNIVQVYEFQDTGDEGQLLSMEYVEGVDLGKLMHAARNRGQRIPPWVAAYITGEAAKGLHYAHERKDEAGQPLAIVHRDVSPQNVLISFDGTVKIADFGIASANLFREEPGVLKGKFAYMSPEQARGESLDRRSDIYSLGVCFHELLTGRPLYQGISGDDVLTEVREGRVLPPSVLGADIAPELDDIVMRALTRDCETRYQTARDMAAAISRAMLARQEFVDASSIEAVLSQLTAREHTSPDGLSNSDENAAVRSVGERSIADNSATIAAAPKAKVGPITSHRDQQVTGQHRRQPHRINREVRHVAIVTVKLHGTDDLELALGKNRAAAALEPIRRTLDDIAYKRGAMWAWDDRVSRARAVVGLLANSSRAAADAASLAVDTHEALAGAAEDLPVLIKASIAIVRGVASGERESDGRLIHHEIQPPADYLASLLGEQSPIGATWVAGGLYRMVRRDFRWADAPPIEVPQVEGQALPRVMRVYNLERPLSREERIAEMSLAPSDLIGRDAEKADLHAAFHRTVAPENGSPTSGPSQHGLVVSRAVVGEVGIGKTALVEAFLAELHDEARVLRVEVSPARTEVPYSVIGAIFREALGVEADATFDDVLRLASNVIEPMSSGLGGQSDAIRRLVATIALGAQPERNEDDDLGRSDKLIAAGVRRILSSLAQQQPIVLVVDGLQWADRPSLELMGALISRAEPLPILVLLVTRADERVLPYLDGVVRLDLRGLTRDEQIRLVESRLGVTEGVASICDDLVPRVAGNPFFMLEMIDALLERGAIELQATLEGNQALVRVDNGIEGRMALPSTLEQILSDRIRELPPEERHIVDWLAVAKGPLSLDDLATLHGESSLDAAIRLCARGVCDQRGESLDLRHTLARDVAYAALSPDERTKMHQRIGEHLTHSSLARGLTAAIVAWHLAKGQAPEKAVDFYLEAAQAARASYQLRHAVRYFRQVVRLTKHKDPRRLLAHEAMEMIARSQGRHRERAEQLTALRNLAKDLGIPKWVALAFVRSARFELDEGRVDRGQAQVQRALAVCSKSRAPAVEIEAYQLLSEILRELGDMAGALRASDQALAIAEEFPASTTNRAKAETLRSRGVALRYLGRVDEAIVAYAEAIAVFRQSGARRQEARAKNSLAFAMFVSERWEDAIALALDAIHIDRDIGGKFQIAKTLSNVGQAYARLGDAVRARAYLRKARDAHERFADQDGRADTLLVSAEVMLELGDRDAAYVFCGDAGALNSVTASGYDTTHEHIVRALIARSEQDHSSCATYAASARELATARGLVSFRLYATALEAAALADLGASEPATFLARESLLGLISFASEYALEIRVLATEALERCNTVDAPDTRKVLLQHIDQVASRIQDPRYKASFKQRPLIAKALRLAPETSHNDAIPPSAPFA